MSQVPFGPPMAIAIIAVVLTDAKECVGWFSVIDAFGQLNDVEGLLQVLDCNVGNSDRSRIADAIRNITAPEAVGGLAKALRQPHLEIRDAAARALQQIGTTSASAYLAGYVESLNKSLRDRDWQIQWDAAAALRRIGTARATEHLLNVFRPNSGVSVLGQAFPDPNAENESVLRAALTDPDENVRFAAAVALTGLREPRGIEPVLALLQSGKPGVLRSTAINVLPTFDDPRAEQMLRSLLSVPDQEERQKARESLTSLIENRLRVQLGVPAKGHWHDLDRLALRQSIEQTPDGEDILERLRHAAKQKNHPLSEQLQAAMGLASLDDRMAFRGLEARYQSADKAERIQIAKGIHDLDNQVLISLWRLIATDATIAPEFGQWTNGAKEVHDPRAAAIIALWKVGDSEGEALLQAQLQIAENHARLDYRFISLEQELLNVLGRYPRAIRPLLRLGKLFVYRGIDAGGTCTIYPEARRMIASIGQNSVKGFHSDDLRELAVTRFDGEIQRLARRELLRRGECWETSSRPEPKNGSSAGNATASTAAAKMALPTKTFSCPCGAKYRIQVELIGKRLKCGKCGKAFIAQQGSSRG